MEKDNKPTLREGFFSKNKFLITFILIIELFAVFRGPRLYGVLIFMITVAILLIISDRDEENEDSEIKKLKKSVLNEIKLIRKSTEKFNYKLASEDKLDKIIDYTGKIIEKYSFIKENYGDERAMDTLEKLVNELKVLEKHLKEVNDKLLNLYVLEESDKELNEDLEYIINQIEARKDL